MWNSAKGRQTNTNKKETSSILKRDVSIIAECDTGISELIQSTLNVESGNNRISDTASERIEIYALYFYVKEQNFMSKDSKTGQRANRRPPPTKIIMERHVALKKWKRYASG